MEKATKMKAVFCMAYGKADVLKIKEINKPTPKNGEVLIKIKVASVTTADSLMRQGKPRFARLILGLTRPKNPIVGTGFSGIIEDKGQDVKDFNIGDEVFGETGFVFSSNAEYVCIPVESLMIPKPLFLTHQEAAPICDGVLTSYSFLKEFGKIQQGQKILINGASGSLGIAAVQLAKVMGAEVTGVCSTRNLDLVKSFGADSVIDYKKSDFTKTAKKYDVIYDTVGTSSFSKCKKVLVENGIYMSPALNMNLLFNMLKTSIFGKQKAIFQATGMRAVPELKELIYEFLPIFEAEKIRTMIDKTFQLKDGIQAHQYVDSGKKRGNVVLVME